MMVLAHAVTSLPINFVFTFVSIVSTGTNLQVLVKKEHDETWNEWNDVRQTRAFQSGASVVCKKNLPAPPILKLYQPI